MTTDDALIKGYGGGGAIAKKNAARAKARAKAAADKKKTKKKIHAERSKRMGPHEYNPKGHRTVVGPHKDSKEAKSKAARKKRIASVEDALLQQKVGKSKKKTGGSTTKAPNVNPEFNVDHPDSGGVRGLDWNKPTRNYGVDPNRGRR